MNPIRTAKYLPTISAMVLSPVERVELLIALETVLGVLVQHPLLPGAK